MTRRTAIAATQAAAAKAEEAAARQLAWLQAQPRRGGPHAQATARGRDEGEPWAEPLATAVRADMVEPDPLVVEATQTAETNLMDAATSVSSHDWAWRERCTALRLDHTDWLHHRLLVTGPAADLARLRAAAAGAGTVPWHLDFDQMEEDLFHLLVAPSARADALGSSSRGFSLAGARILASQLRAASARRHALAVDRVGRSKACPFDLHVLIPVPDDILQRGPNDATALDWLWVHWGTTQTLRHVVEDEAAAGEMATRGIKAPGERMWALTFWSADWTPWRALVQIAARWPALRFDTRPRYDLP